MLSEIIKMIDQNNPKQARALLNSHYANQDVDQEYYTLRAAIDLQDGNIEQAERLLLQGVQAYPKALDIQFNLAYIYELQHQWLQAKKAYEESLHCGGTFDDTRTILEKISLAAQRLREQRMVTENPYGEGVTVLHTGAFERANDTDGLHEKRRRASLAFGEGDAPLVSIYIVAYNKLELHTKTCIDSLLTYTDGIDYELILVDNGSTDGTLEFFKSVPYKNKQVIHISHNVGAFYASNLAVRRAKGQYLAWLDNDVYVTQNWLTNLLHCMLSSPDIGMVVPTSDNVSNLQLADFTFDTLEEMQAKAAIYNISDSLKWHERMRLIPPLCVFSKPCLDVIGGMDYGFFHDFGDDDITFRVRNAGYRAILCKDTFVCHAGKIGWKDPAALTESLELGRKDFIEKYRGLDAWVDVNNYELYMMASIEAKAGHHYSVLGIDVRCGTPLMEAKNKLLGTGAAGVRLEAFTQEAKYWSYLNAVTDEPPICDRLMFLSEHLRGRQYDVILLGRYVNGCPDLKHLFSVLWDALRSGGMICLKVENHKDAYAYEGFFTSSNKENLAWVPNVEVLPFRNLLEQQGFRVDQIIAVQNNEILAQEEAVRRMVNETLADERSREYMYTQLTTEHYFIKISKP